MTELTARPIFSLTGRFAKLDCSDGSPMATDEKDSSRLPVGRLAQGIFALAILAAIAGAVYFFAARPAGPEGIEVTLAPPETPAELRVYITGAVRNPDVYVAKEGDWLGLLVEAAGGATEDADIEAVNLAARLRDEDHWHIPRLGEAPTGATGSSELTRSRKIDLNSASLEELKSLRGIGDTRASSIIRYRELHGPFSTVDDLDAITGIGAGTIDTIRDLVEAR